MKTNGYGIMMVLLCCFFYHESEAQSLEDRIFNKAKQRADRKIDRAIDKGLDKVEEGVDESAKEATQKETGEEKNKDKKKKDSPSNNKNSEAKNSTSPATQEFKAYTKFDFIPGEKVIAYDDFSQDAAGDFPAKWNTNSSAEIVTFSNHEGQWLSLTSAGVVTPEFISSLPENFTLEFDLLVTPDYSFYDSWFSINLLAVSDKKQAMNWKSYEGKRTGIEVRLHPQDAGNGPYGRSAYALYAKGSKTMYNDINQLASFNAKNKSRARVSIWRQNQRLRVYVNEAKVWDLPRAFEKEVIYNAVFFEKDNAKEGSNYYIKDVRLAIGKPDTRSKLLTEGKFSTTGIYFNTNSATIKPESYGVIKEIADVLKENSSVKIMILGHTDADGDDAYNLDLSKKRSLAVKQTLSKDFGIDESRMKTDGKGETEPVSPNSTTEGKAANRRVEFIKL